MDAIDEVTQQEVQVVLVEFGEVVLSTSRAHYFYFVVDFQIIRKEKSRR